MATNTFSTAKHPLPEQNSRVANFPNIQSKWFNGSKSVSGSANSTTPTPLVGRRIRLLTASMVFIDETFSASDGTWSFIRLRDDINDIAEGLIVTKQRDGIDGYAQMRDRLSAV
jgi:hypothetical protein